MPEYRRAFAPGGTFFLTIVSYERRPLFVDPENVSKLFAAIHMVQVERPYQMSTYVVLPDHIHMIWKLPSGDADFSARVGRMKVLFTKSVRQELGSGCPPYVDGRSPSQVNHRESGLWQRRFWEHTIRDEADFQRHVDYIHYNPVNHKLVACPHAWAHSSSQQWVHDGQQWVHDGVNLCDWCCQ